MDRRLRDTLADIEDRHWWYEGRRRILSSVIRRLPLPGRADILEVGCGAGGNLAMLAAFGSVWACEPDPADRERAAARDIGPVEAGALPGDLPFGDRAFDLIAVLDVLEHVDDDAGSLVALRDRLNPDGLLVVTVPAHPWLWSGHDVRNGHVRRYRRAELEGRIAEAGLELVRQSYFNTVLAPIAAVVRLYGPASAGLQVPPDTLNRALIRVLSWEAGPVGRSGLPFGISLLAVARRPANSDLAAPAEPIPG